MSLCSLGQLASLAGIDKSDFQPLGRPQLSSTIGPHLDGAASLTRGESRDVQAQTCASVRIYKTMLVTDLPVAVDCVIQWSLKVCKAFRICSISA